MKACFKTASGKISAAIKLLLVFPLLPPRIVPSPLSQDEANLNSDDNHLSHYFEFIEKCTLNIIHDVK